MKTAKQLLAGLVGLVASGWSLAAPVTTGQELLDAVEAASDTEPSVIEVVAGDVYLTATLKLKKPITVRGAGTGATPADGLPAVDLFGNPRVLGKAVDLGCRELPAPSGSMAILR